MRIFGTSSMCGEPLELLETLSMTFWRFYSTQHSNSIQTESISESKVLDLTVSD